MDIIVFLSSLSVYLFTLAPGIVAAGDNAELITSAWTLGIAHPPGYPLFSFLGKLVCFLPVSSIAARVNLLSALFGSLAVYLLYLSILKLTRDKAASALGALSFAFSLLFWKYSVIAEVFTLNTLFAAVLLYLLLLWKDSKNTAFIFLSAFLFGLGLANHQTLVFILPAVLLFIFSAGRRALSAKTLLLSSGLFLLGLLFYVYLPLRAAANPPVNWMDPQTLEGFKKAIFRNIYGGVSFNFSQMFTLKDSVFYDYWLNFLSAFWYAGALFIAAGFYFLAKKKDLLVLPALLFTGVFFVFMLSYDNNPVFFSVARRFYLLSFLFGAVLLGCGASLLTTGFSKKAKYALPALIVLPLALNFGPVSRAGDNFLRDFCVDTLRCCKTNSTLLVTGDSTIMGFDYFSFVDKRRPDVLVFSMEKLSHKWYVDTLRRGSLPVSFPFERIQVNQTLETFFDSNPDRTFYCLGIPREKIGPSYSLYNRLLVSEARKNPPNAGIFAEIASLSDASRVFFYSTSSTRPADFREELIVFCARTQLDTGFFFYSNRLLKEAVPFYETSLAMAPGFPDAYKHLGKLYFDLKEPAKSKEYFSKYLALNKSNDPDTKVLQDFVNSK